DWHDRLKSLVTENSQQEGQALLIDHDAPPSTGLIPALSSVLQPKDKIENQALAHILGQAGFNGPGVVHSFLAFKLITMCVLGVLGAGIAAACFAADGATIGLAGMS